VSLASILVIFVLNPKIPSNFHNSISPSRVILDSSQAQVRQNEPENAFHNDNLSKWVEQVHQSTETDLDKEVVRYLAQEEHQFDPETIQLIGKTKLLAITQYQLKNGEMIVIYTPLPNEAIGYARAY
jgi:hypothetical protein